MNTSIQKLISYFLNKIEPDELSMLKTVEQDIAFNYVFFLYKKIFGDYPTGEVYKILEAKFLKSESFQQQAAA